MIRKLISNLRAPLKPGQPLTHPILKEIKDFSGLSILKSSSVDRKKWRIYRAWCKIGASQDVNSLYRTQQEIKIEKELTNTYLRRKKEAIEQTPVEWEQPPFLREAS
jgi:hypothetical protein